MVGFVEIDLSKSKDGCVELEKIKDGLNTLITGYSTIKTIQVLTDFKLNDDTYSLIDSYKYLYLSKHTRDTDSQELTLYHIFLDYYEILLN